MIGDLGYESIVLDFSDTENIFSEEILPIITTINSYKQEESINFQAILPNKTESRKKFVSSNWLYFLDPKQHKSLADEGYDNPNFNYPATLFRNYEEQNSIVSEIIYLLKNKLYLDSKIIYTIDWLITELTDNSITHYTSGSVTERAENNNNYTFCLIQMSHLPKKKEIQFVISDSGVGIPNSLREGLGGDWQDDVAIMHSIREGVTRGTGQGNGLFGSISIAQSSGGAFAINSGYGYLNLSRVGKITHDQSPDKIKGTHIFCNICYEGLREVEDAIKFKKTTYKLSEIIKTKMEEDLEGYIAFYIKNEAKSVRNRASGIELRNRISQYVINGNNKINIDFSEIGIVSSSFIDEFLVKLLQELGTDKFNSNILITNMNETIRYLFSRSASQRLG